MKIKDFSVGVQHRIFNNEIRKRRVELGLTQKQLGKLVGLSGGVINHYENFRGYPTTLEKAENMARVLNSDVETLFPEWLKVFKPKKTSIITEHTISVPLLSSNVPSYLLEDGQEQFEDELDKKIVKDALDDAFRKLSDREARVIKMRFGFENPTSEELERLDGLDTTKWCSMTLEEVGKVFGVTRDRIRQIEAKALQKLKKPLKEKLGKDFVSFLSV